MTIPEVGLGKAFLTETVKGHKVPPRGETLWARTSARREQRLGLGAGEEINGPESHLEAGERRKVAELAQELGSLSQG